MCIYLPRNLSNEAIGWQQSITSIQKQPQRGRHFMSNNLQQYNNGGNGEGGFSKWVMVAALVYAVAPDLIPGPVDDMGGVLLALALVGIVSLFGGGK